MDCGMLSNVECVLESVNIQEIKMFFILFFLSISLFFIIKMTPKYIENITKKNYHENMLKLIRVLSIGYIFLSPFVILMYTTDIDLELFIGYHFLYYVPIMLYLVFVLMFMSIDWLFSKFGFEDFMDFRNKLKRR